MNSTCCNTKLSANCHTEMFLPKKKILVYVTIMFIVTAVRTLNFIQYNKANIHTILYCVLFMLPLLPWKLNNKFNFYCCWHISSCQQYKSLQCCHGNATMNSFALLPIYKIFHVAVNNNMY